MSNESKTRKEGKKEMYEKLFNEVFGTSIKWSKLSIEELTQLATVLANPEALIKKLGGVPSTEVGQATLVEVLKKLVSAYDGPIVKLIKKYLMDVTAEDKGK